MSGGYFDCDYSYSYRLNDMADVIERDGNVLFASLLRDVAKLLHDYDWWKSGDTDREGFMKSWKAFLDKWQDNSPEELSVENIEGMIHKIIWDSLGLPPDERYDKYVEDRR